MKEKGKAVEVSNGNNYLDFSYSSLELSCKKHPSSSSVGICAYCLKDRLIKLVCSDCGEQRLSSCSCSDVSSYRNSCSTLEVGSVGRISFLIENEKSDQPQHFHSQHKREERKSSEDGGVMLKRSSSSCVEIKRSNGFWRIGKLFRKKREKGTTGFDEKSDLWMSENMGVSRSRSLCSFRGTVALNDPDHEGSEFAFSSAKISDVNGSLQALESEKQYVLETAPRRSGFRGALDAENGVDLKESDFNGMDESGFIDLKLDLSSESKAEYSALKMGEFPISVSGHYECGGNFGSLKTDLGMFGEGGSCRITVNERGIKKGSKGQKVWRWFFRHNPPGWRSASTKKDGDGNHILKL